MLADAGQIYTWSISEGNLARIMAELARQIYMNLGAPKTPTPYSLNR
jgi:hypothetical protein